MRQGRIIQDEPASGDGGSHDFDMKIQDNQLFVVFLALLVNSVNGYSVVQVYQLSSSHTQVCRCASLTCNQEFSSASGLSSAVGGSDRKSSAVCGGHSRDPQNSAAVAERDLSAGQSGSRKNLAITEPAHLRNWRTCATEWRTQN